MMTAIDVEADHQELILAGSNKELLQIIKGKRTKRPRPPSPVTLQSNSASNQTNSIEFEERSSKEEEEDMANCLVLLSQAGTTKPVVASTSTASGLYVYECKTCSKSFSSFQALGGHRASHKKPKTDNHQQPNSMIDHRKAMIENMGTALSFKIINGVSNKVHECSICGAEFASGQALGGHMRRHRSSLINSSSSTSSMTATTSSPDRSLESKKSSRNVLELDLNLPAPEGDHESNIFKLGSRDDVIVFSATSLVDRHRIHCIN